MPTWNDVKGAETVSKQNNGRKQSFFIWFAIATPFVALAIGLGLYVFDNPTNMNYWYVTEPVFRRSIFVMLAFLFVAAIHTGLREQKHRDETTDVEDIKIETQTEVRREVEVKAEDATEEKKVVYVGVPPQPPVVWKYIRYVLLIPVGIFIGLCAGTLRARSLGASGGAILPASLILDALQRSVTPMIIASVLAFIVYQISMSRFMKKMKAWEALQETTNMEGENNADGETKG